MEIALIWAMTRNRVIGRDNDLPWKLPDEMRHFVRTTRGKPVIMGRRQYESMPEALPSRLNIVLTRNPAFAAPDAEVVRDFDTALDRAQAAARASGVDEIMVIGGADIFRLALPRADRLYMTVIDAELEGDTFFPAFDESGWREIEREDHPADARHAHAYSIRTLVRAK